MPELLAETEFDFFIGKAAYIVNPLDFTWVRILESEKPADSVLQFEKELTHQFPANQKYAFESHNGIVIRQYSTAFTIAFNKKLEGMIERRMRQSVFAVASFWYTAWVNAGEPDLARLSNKEFSADDLQEFQNLSNAWKNSKIQGQDHEE